MKEGSISHLIESLNEKSRAAGCAVRAESWERTEYGTSEGVRLQGDDVERATAYVLAYYKKHLAPKRSAAAQYHYSPQPGGVISLVYWPE